MSHISPHRSDLSRAWRAVVWSAAVALVVSGAAWAQAPVQTEGPPSTSTDPAEISVALSGLGTATAPLVSRPLPALPPPFKVDKTFEGFHFDDNAVENFGFRFIPPDAIGAAGQNRVIAVVNSMIESRTKGGQLKWRQGLFDFFAPLAPQDFPFDPKIIHDHYADRFVVVALELLVGTASQDPANISRILLAVSKNGNPKSATDWHFQAIDAKQTIFGSFDGWADYPGFEADEEAVYITANIFTFAPFGFFGGTRVWIADKGVGTGGFYDGGPLAVNAHNPYFGNGGIATTTMPTQVFGPGGVGGPGSDLGTFLVSYSGLSDGVDEYVQIVTIVDPLGTPTFVQEFLNIGDIESFDPVPLPDAPQLGGPALIEVNDRRALDAVWRDDHLWLTTTINPNYPPEAGQTTAHWFELDTSGGPGFISLWDQGDIGGEDIAPGTFTFFAAVAVNSARTAQFGFSASAPSIYAGAYVAGREAGDAPATVQPALAVHAGEDYYERTFGGPRNRWGDYSGIAVDAVNDEFFWVFNQYAEVQGPPDIRGHTGRWGTAWGRTK